MTFGATEKLNKHSRPNQRIFLALALLSAALIAYQINLVQIFSYVQWYHFAYMAISIAMLGLGAAGTVLTIFEKQLTRSYATTFPLLCFTASISMAGLMLLRGVPWLHYETYHFQFSSLALVKLIGSYLLLIVPFFFAALCIGLVFTKYTHHIGRLYAFDLTGAGVGALVAIFLSLRFLPHQTGILLAIFPLIAGLLCMDKKRRKKRWIMPALAALSLVIIYHITEQPQLSEYKSLSKALLLPEAKIEISHPHPQGVLQVLSSPILRHGSGLSLTFDGTIPIVKGVFRNGEWIGHIGNQWLSDTTHLYDYTGYALPFYLGFSGDILIAGDPSAAFVQYALKYAPTSITSILESDDLISLLKEHYAVETDSVWFHPTLNFKVNRLRSFLLSDTSHYDLVILPDIGNFGGTGLHSVKEEYAFTRESLALIWNRLSPNGVVAVNCWLDAPARAPLRFFHLMIDLLRSHGIDDPLEHIIAVKNWGTVTYVMRKSEWDTVSYRSTDNFCGAIHFDPLINHGRIGPAHEMTHTSEDSSFIPMIEHISRAQTTKIRDYDFDLSVPTDNQPFFYQFVKVARIKKLMKIYGQQGLFVELGYFFMLLTLVFITIFALVFILLPLFRIGFSGPLRVFTLLYFGAIGIGYMCIEIAFIHRSIPYLGAPVYAFSATLAALLISSGFGSLFSRRFGGRIASLKRYGLVLLLILLMYNYAADVIWNFVGQISVLRQFIAFIIIAIPGFFMGMFFPAGMRFLSDEQARLMVPWAWGINGFFSVISAVLAMLLAIEAGFQMVINIAIVAYVVAILVVMRQQQTTIS